MTGLTAIERLGDRGLRNIAGALGAGRLMPTYETLAGRRACGEGEVADAVAAELARLAAQGWTPTQLAILVGAMADARQSVHARQTIDLVWTGPELEGAPSRDTSVVVDELFGSVQRSVLVAGYVVCDGRRIFETLARRMDEDPDLGVQMFLNIERKPTDTSLASDIVARFVERFREREWPGKRLPQLYYDPRALELDPSRRASLHAKCIVIDGRVSFVSSANFTEAALVRNIEAGVRIESEAFADHLQRHFDGLVNAGAMRGAV